MRIPFLATSLAACASVAIAAGPPPIPAKSQGTGPLDRSVEVHHRLVLAPGEQAVALTLDACGGDFDAALVDLLVEHRIPATIFATRLWIAKNPAAVRRLAARPDLFAVENHGDSHRAPVLGEGRSVYGVPGVADLAALDREVEGGAGAIVKSGFPKPSWFRGATARYDREAMAAIGAMGYRIAGFSVNGDFGATLPRSAVASRLAAAVPGDVILMHVNKPAGEGAEGLRDALPGLLAKGLVFVKLRDREVAPVSGPAR